MRATTTHSLRSPASFLWLLVGIRRRDGERAAAGLKARCGGAIHPLAACGSSGSLTGARTYRVSLTDHPTRAEAPITLRSIREIFSHLRWVDFAHCQVIFVGELQRPSERLYRGSVL